MEEWIDNPQRSRNVEIALKLQAGSVLAREVAALRAEKDELNADALELSDDLRAIAISLGVGNGWDIGTLIEEIKRLKDSINTLTTNLYKADRTQSAYQQAVEKFLQGDCTYAEWLKDAPQ